MDCVCCHSAAAATYQWLHVRLPYNACCYCHSTIICFQTISLESARTKDFVKHKTCKDKDIYSYSNDNAIREYDVCDK